MVHFLYEDVKCPHQAVIFFVVRKKNTLICLCNDNVKDTSSKLKNTCINQSA